MTAQRKALSPAAAVKGHGRMRYLSVCSGIEAASVAWHPLGWEAAAFSEIEAFPRAVLTHRWPGVPLHGDFTTIRGDEYGPIDLLVGGTPCQSFSVAGLRGGLDDERGNLALEFLRLADRTRPEWLVWENVPGVLSSNGGRDFGAILGGMVELGYGFAYRVLDAQFFGIPQRRRRVFVVGCLGDWRGAAAVLFERHSLSGNPPPSRKTGEGVAPTIASRPSGGGGLGTDFDCDGGLISMCLNAHPTRLDAESETLIAHTLKGDGFDASEDGTGRGTPIIAFSSKDHGADADHIAPTLRAGGHSKSHANAGVPPAIVFDTTQITSKENRCRPAVGDPCHPLASGAHAPAIATSICLGSDPIHANELAMPQTSRNGDPGVVQRGSSVRRLTPCECEALQGFPRNYTLIPYRGKLAADGPRYKALGNSMAVPVMSWIGRRIQAVSCIRPSHYHAAAGEQAVPGPREVSV